MSCVSANTQCKCKHLYQSCVPWIIQLLVDFLHMRMDRRKSSYKPQATNLACHVDLVTIGTDYCSCCFVELL